MIKNTKIPDLRHQSRGSRNNKIHKIFNTGRKPGWLLDAVLMWVVDTEEEVVEEEEGEDDHDHEIVTGEETSEAVSEDQEQDCECLSPAHPDNQWQI